MNYAKFDQVDGIGMTTRINFALMVASAFALIGVPSMMGQNSGTSPNLRWPS